jgi:hypothetical protein
MANPLLGSLVDPFTAATLNATQWNSVTAGTVTLVPALGMAQLACPTAIGTNTLGANGPYDATAGTLYARVTPVLRGNGGTRAVMKIQVDANNSAAIRFNGGVFTATSQTAGTTTTYNLPTYDPTGHAWWRLREASGTWYAETSADGYAWTTQATMTYGWSPLAVQVLFQTGSSDTEPSGLFAAFEHVNTMAGPSVQMPSWPQVRFGIAFNQNASNAGSPAFVDLSSRLRGSWSAALSGRQYELDQVQSGQMTVALWNLDGALDPLNTSSPYSPNVVPMKPGRLQAVWPPTRNLLPQNISTGTAPSSAWFAFVGSAPSATGLLPAPTGHTTATAWTFPIVGSSANGYPLLTGTTSGGADATAFPVVGGLPYVLTGWLSRSPGGDTTVGITSEVLFYDQTGAQVGAATSTLAAVPVQGTWAQLSASGTTPAGAICARLAFFLTNTSTTAVNTIYLAALQLEQSASATPWTPGGVVYGLWAGFVERFPQHWDNTGTYGLVDLTCVDALATLADFTMTPNTPGQLLALSPTRLYPLDEPSGSTKFRDMTGKHGFVTANASSYGAGTVTAGSSVTGTGFVGAAGPVVTLANPAPSNTPGAGSYLNLGTPNGPPSSGGWTRLICFRTTTVPSSANMTIWNACGAAYGGASASLYIDSSQHVNAQVTSLAGNSLSAAVPTIAVCDGNWHMAAIILDPTGKILNVNVDGTGYTISGSADCHTSGIVSDTIGANIIPTSRYNGNYFSGDIAYACEIPTNNVPSFSDIAAGFSTGWAGETSAVRAQRILTLSGYKGPLGTQDMTTAMGGATLSGQDAMSALQLVGDSESGQVYVDGSGTVQLAGRLWRYYQNAPAVLVGEQQTTSGEIPYLGDVAVDFDTTHIYNQVSVTNQGAPGSAQQPAALSPNPTSATAYAPRTLQRTINVLDPTVPQYAANYLSQQYGQPLARIAQLTVDPASNPALWSVLLGLGFGSRVQVSRRPPTGPGAQPIVLQQFLEHLTWNGDDKGNFRASMQLSSATPFLNWWVISSLHSTLQAQSNSGTNTITLGALTGASLNPAAAVLTPGTVLTVGYGTTVAESATVQSVAATTAGYTTVVVTLTANLTNTHTSGQTVCQPLPGGYTLPALPLAGFPASLDAAATLSATGPRVTY